MKFPIAFLLLLVIAPVLTARTLEVRAGGPYENLESAAAAVLPGDTIIFRAGVYAGGEYVEGLQGTASAWITIMAPPGEEVVLRGGTNAWQLSDPAWLRISGFVLEGQTGNGLNIDDAGTFDTPAHHVIIERCTWRGIDASGNNDLLKLSGLDSFEVRACVFLDGAAGGSMIDMVGCHNGSFTGNRFERAGSNCIQAKGGTRYIRIERNTFIDGGARAINIGGSTGLQFFRPQGANSESADIRIYSNVFVGSDAPVAFVGTVNSEVVNNTIWLPGRWVMRILQETTGSGFLQCGDNVFRNNIVVVGNAAASPAVNIGPNTRPESFIFSGNLWYNVDDADWGGPNLPSAESGGIIGADPMLVAPPGDMSLRNGSPAIGAGYPVAEPVLDYNAVPFAAPRAIGAFAATGMAGAAERGRDGNTWMRIMVPSAGTVGEISFDLGGMGDVEVAIHDMGGAWIRGEMMYSTTGVGVLHMALDDLPSGAYMCVVRRGSLLLARPFVLVR